jgi:hypothetical protein
MPLTERQKTFLFTQKIPLSEVLDATGLSKAEYQARMEEQDKLFAFGVTPCKEAGHTIRTKAGHCIECSTARIAYQRRHHIKGVVYIAGSHSKKLIKIGCTNDIDNRLKDLITGGYGQATDWEILLSAHGVLDAGRVECAVHRELINHNIAGTYIKQGRENICYELFRCSYKIARDFLLNHIPASTQVRKTDENRLLAVYNF